jgi:hypothetical protein
MQTGLSETKETLTLQDMKQSRTRKPNSLMVEALQLAKGPQDVDQGHGLSLHV